MIQLQISRMKRIMTQDMSNDITTRNIGNLTRGLSPCAICFVVSLLLMMVVGVSGVKAATIDFNLPDGYYYLGNEAGANDVAKYDGSNFSANFYMCPAYSTTVDEQNYLGGDSSKPLITTFKSFSDNSKNQGKTYLHAIWYIEAATGDNAGYFYIKHYESGQYLVANDNNSPSATRRRVNLAPIDPENPTAKPGNDGMFKIQSDDNGVTYYLSSRTKASDNNKYLSPSAGNKDNLSATSDNSNTGGILGFWRENTKNSAWHFVDAQCATPVIAYTTNSNEITIESSTPGATIYYTSTTDGTEPATPTTSSYTGTGSSPLVINNVAATAKFKAIAVKDGMLDSEVASQITTIGTLNPTVTLASWTYGSPKNPSVSGNKGNGAVTYSYKKKTDDDTKYSANKPVNVGEYTVKAEIAETTTYLAGSATTDFSITPAPLTIKANAQAKDYLDADPELTYTVTGLKNNDIERNVIICVLQRASGESGENATPHSDQGSENVGSYDITENTSQRKLKSDNYTFSSFTKATFTINKKNLGDGETPAPGIGINMKDVNPKTVSVYNGNNALSPSDYTYEVSEKDADGNYTVTITAAGNNCTGSAKATYSPVAEDFFYPIDANDPQSDKIAAYISATDQMASADLVPCIVGQVNPTVGTISVVPVSYIPKDVPVLLLAKHDVTGMTTSPKNEKSPVISDALLSSNKLMIAPDEPSDSGDPTSTHGVHVESTEAYMYYKGEFVLTTAGTIKTGNYYLYNPNYQTPADPSTPTPAPSRSLTIVKSETTGIITRLEVRSEMEDGVWYTIDGQKLNKKPTRKGLYIKNGRKAIVK